MKRLAFCSVLLLLFLGLTGCSGKEKSININKISESTLLARTNGEIQVATVEDFDKSYYDLTELQDYIDKKIGFFNKKAGADNRRGMLFHKLLLDGALPLSIGGGIGQSRLSMLLLEKAHIGEVQISVWDKDTIDACEKSGIVLL
jgi:asparagine synthetase A